MHVRGCVCTSALVCAWNSAEAGMLVYSVPRLKLVTYLWSTYKRIKCVSLHKLIMSISAWISLLSPCASSWNSLITSNTLFMLFQSVQRRTHVRVSAAMPPLTTLAWLSSHSLGCPLGTTGMGLWRLAFTLSSGKLWEDREAAESMFVSQSIKHETAAALGRERIAALTTD